MSAFRRSGSALARVAALLVAAGACRPAKQDEQISRVRATEDSVRPFSPFYARDTARRHVALFFRFANQQLTLDPAPPAIRPGNLPYRPARGGDFRVAYLDAARQMLGSYSIEDPTMVRSCDVSEGRTGEVKTVPAVRIELLLPVDPRIAFVEVTSAVLQTRRYDVSAALRRAVPAAPSDTGAGPPPR